MKKKNKIEQELDRKEFEKDIHRDLSDQYNKLDVKEKFIEGKNKYVLGGMHFSSTLLFFEAWYLMIKWSTNYFTLGYTSGFFDALGPFVHIAVLILCVHSVFVKRSAVEVIIDKWPF